MKDAAQARLESLSVELLFEHFIVGLKKEEIVRIKTGEDIKEKR